MEWSTFSFGHHNAGKFICLGLGVRIRRVGYDYYVESVFLCVRMRNNQKDMKHCFKVLGTRPDNTKMIGIFILYRSLLINLYPGLRKSGDHL